MGYVMRNTKFIFILLFFISCCPKHKSPENFKSVSEIIGESDTLKIIVEKTECGEWGGNREHLYIINNNGIISANLKIDTISCDSVLDKNRYSKLDDSKRIIIYNSLKVINSSEEKMIVKMLQRLLNLYISPDKQIEHFGDYYTIINTDKTLQFKYFNSYNDQETHYYKTRKHLFGNIKY